MRICIFEDTGFCFLEPLTLTRAAFDLWCGASPLRERHRRAFVAGELGAIVRHDLAELCRLEHPDLAVNDPSWLQGGPVVMVNARWLPGALPIDDVTTPQVGLVNDQVAFAVLAAGVADITFETIDTWAKTWKEILPHRVAPGDMLDYPWDLVEANSRMLIKDRIWFAENPAFERRDAAVAVQGPPDDFLVHKEADIEPFVNVDVRNGPVLIDRGARVHSFTRLEGPCYVGPETWLVGAKVHGGTIGPCCRIGGEFEASIVQGYSNKYHDGFLGHSYLGEWVNIAAGTQVSDLRNDYAPIHVSIAGQRVSSGLTKIGVYMGDHSKTALAALINSGSVVGAFSNLLPTGSLLPSLVPSFCNVRYGQLQERNDLRQAFNTAATVMRRRGRELTGTHVDFFFNLFESTAAQRARAIRESEQRRLRRSV
jgi:UDP-N-acetylglucosamine diphosphorylase/glucosamine-1-phosphate N-acetyltransferase